ncbi:hypothetical protein NDU88_005638 [Pleurodeles waltl]|uniref:Uncharacterized protein n=1 Tax=Pleurodeles waltl TaxID=8319 RepID=A0AAV7PP62_PLEWA|nr:hypothetical protein NDU88_005638 [Pleurodeles waltl]
MSRLTTDSVLWRWQSRLGLLGLEPTFRPACLPQDGTHPLFSFLAAAALFLGVNCHCFYKAPSPMGHRPTSPPGEVPGIGETGAHLGKAGKCSHQDYCYGRERSNRLRCHSSHHFSHASPRTLELRLNYTGCVLLEI